jgi:hypothetical protein
MEKPSFGFSIEAARATLAIAVTLCKYMTIGHSQSREAVLADHEIQSSNKLSLKTLGDRQDVASAGCG